MPVVWGAHNNSDIYINVGIIDASAINLASMAPVSATPIAPPSMFRALVDTGAQKTMISPNVISTLNLPPLGKILISGVGPSAHYHNAYLFHVPCCICYGDPWGYAISGGASLRRHQCTSDSNLWSGNSVHWRPI